MMKTLFVFSLVAAGLVSGAAQAIAGGSPVGVWLDGKGRGAIEIKECGRGKLCGHVVWVRNSLDQHGCGQQLIGDLREMRNGDWDQGWIVDPDDLKKYDVALERVNRSQLKVTGYMGTKLFSRDFYWKKAPASLKRCDEFNTKVETVVAAREEPPVSLGPVTAPHPVRNPMDNRFVVADITPPAPVLAERPVQVAVMGPSLSPEAVAALEIMNVSDRGDLPEGLMSLNGPDRLVTSNQKSCKVLAPFVSFVFPCSR